MSRCAQRRRGAQRGERNANALFTEPMVLEIRAAHARGTSYAALARLYRVHLTTIRSVVVRRTWAHL